MIAEQTPRSRHVTEAQENRRDLLYGDIDVRIGLVKDLLLVATCLPIPRSTQTPAEIKAENDAMCSIADQAEQLFSTDSKKLRRLQYLYAQQEILERPSLPTPDDGEPEILKLLRKLSTQPDTLICTDTKRYDALGKKIKVLEDDPGVTFLDSFEYGIYELIQKRKALRESQEGHGGEIDENGWANNPYDYDVLTYIPTAVQYRRFSIGLYFDLGDFSMLADPKKSGVHTIGINTHISHRALETGEFMSSIDIGGQPYYIEPDNLRTAAHEETHAFLEGFRNLYSLTTLGESEEPLKRDIMSEIKAYQSRRTPEGKARLSWRLRKIADFSGEELLAEFASDIDRANIPQATYRNIHTRTRDVMRDAFGGDDQEINQLIEESHPKIDFEKIKDTRIKELYARIAENCPDKIIDLDIAFGLFPASGIGRIEAMVDRWIDIKEEREKAA